MHAVPAAPESAKALVIPQPPSQSAVQFSWKPPKNGTNVDKYIITLKFKGKLHETKPLVPGVSPYDLISNSIMLLKRNSGSLPCPFSVHSLQNATEYTVTLNETLSASDKVDATVRMNRSCMLVLSHFSHNRKYGQGIVERWV